MRTNDALKRILVYFVILIVSALLFLGLRAFVIYKTDNGLAGKDKIVSCPVDSTNQYIFDGYKDLTSLFYRQVSSNVDPNENFMVSPLCLIEGLTMLSNGAKGETQKQILDLMGIDAKSQMLANKTLSSLISYLPRVDKCNVLSMANSQWIDKSCRMVNSYVQNNKRYFGVETYTKDLSTESTMNEINSWCDRKTDGCIKKILNKPYDDIVKMVLINALFFKGTWVKKFDGNDTYPGTFNNYDGTKSSVMMMFQSDSFRARTGKKMDIVEFPYDTGIFCMDVFLPHEGVSLDDCLKDFDLKNLNLNSMDYEQVDVGMPKMGLKFNRSLVSDLKSMGMSDAFDSNLADFSGLSYNKICLSEMEQVTSLNVDENGTWAAAVQHEYCAVLSMVMNSINFNMDRPFAFLIRDRQTETLLFIGRIAKL